MRMAKKDFTNENLNSENQRTPPTFFILHKKFQFLFLMVKTQKVLFNTMFDDDDADN